MIWQVLAQRKHLKLSYCTEEDLQTQNVITVDHMYVTSQMNVRIYDSCPQCIHKICHWDWIVCDLDSHRIKSEPMKDDVRAWCIHVNQTTQRRRQKCSVYSKWESYNEKSTSTISSSVSSETCDDATSSSDADNNKSSPQSSSKQNSSTTPKSIVLSLDLAAQHKGRQHRHFCNVWSRAFTELMLRQSGPVGCVFCCFLLFFINSPNK